MPLLRHGMYALHKGYPTASGAILRYMLTVMDMTSKGWGRAGQKYDVAFRWAREVSHAV